MNPALLMALQHAGKMEEEESSEKVPEEAEIPLVEEKISGGENFEVMVFFGDESTEILSLMEALRKEPCLHLICVRRCVDVVVDMSRWFGLLQVPA